MPKTTAVPRRAGMRPPDILRAAYEASGRSQPRFAEDVLGMSASGFKGWLGGKPCPPVVVRLCWAITDDPALADRIAARFTR